MLLQKTGWRMKQFVSHRRNSSMEDYNENLKGFLPDQKVVSARSTANNSQRASWISQDPQTEIQTIRGASGDEKARIHPSPHVSSTAHSSASSLCSCECAANTTSSNSLFAPAPARMEPRPEIFHMPPISSTPSGKTKMWQLIFPENTSRTPACSLRRDIKSDAGTVNVRYSTFNLLEALEIDPIDRKRTPKQRINNMEASDREIFSENVEQLIRETDAAFQAVGTALTDAKTATQPWCKDSTSEHVCGSLSLSRRGLKKDLRPPMTSLKSPAAQTKSVTKKPKRKNPNLLSRASPTLINTSARWSLTGVTSNLVDAFNGKMFRTEVDEILTADRLHRLREEERIEIAGRNSVESTCSVETGGSTPTKPFHLEDLSSRITVAQYNEASTVTISSPLLLSPVTTSRRKIPLRKDDRAEKAKGIVESCMKFQDHNFPSPPQVPNRFNARGTLPPLPTIPEGLPLDPIPPLESRKFSEESIQSLPAYIILPSTSFTLTSPLFRQGPIRIERKEKEWLPEEELDWTAFQMAISGTMDEISVSEMDDIIWAADESELDELLDWWAGYRFHGYGRMIQGLSPSIEHKRKPEVIALDMEKVSGTDKIVVEPVMHIEPVRWMTREYAESLPPSPMLALSPPTPSKEEEVIPMGFNLGHDLGDFLDWETHYVRKYFTDD